MDFSFSSKSSLSAPLVGGPEAGGGTHQICTPRTLYTHCPASTVEPAQAPVFTEEPGSDSWTPWTLKLPSSRPRPGTGRDDNLYQSL